MSCYSKTVWSTQHCHHLIACWKYKLSSPIPELGLPQWLTGKEFACNAEDAGDGGSIPRSGRSPGEGKGNPLQYSCLENPMDARAWWVMVHWVTTSWTLLSTHTHTHTPELLHKSPHLKKSNR